MPEKRPEFLTERGHQLPRSKVSQRSDFWAYLDLGLDVLRGVGGVGSKHVRISDDTDIKRVKEFIVNQ